MRQMIASRVAVQDLQQEEVNRRHRIEHPLAPTVSCFQAELPDRLRLQIAGYISLDPPQHMSDIRNHPWPPVEVASLNTTTILTGGLFTRPAQSAGARPLDAGSYA
jgi:hypothetical protein